MVKKNVVDWETITNFVIDAFVGYGNPVEGDAGVALKMIRNGTADEKEHMVRLAREAGVPINESVQKEIMEVCDKLGLTQYKFPWEE